MPEWLSDLTKINPIVPIVTYVLGFMTSRFTLTKKERKDLEQKQFENSKSLLEAQHERFQSFCTALLKYANKDGDPTLDDFFDIATEGEKYFYQQKITADAILAGKVDKQARDNTLIPKIKETLDTSLPKYYETLQSISSRKGIAYHGKLERKNYESLYLAVERFGALSAD
jgi:hypothetical protein